MTLAKAEILETLFHEDDALIKSHVLSSFQSY